IYLMSHELQEGAEVITRQVQNEALRRLGLWEKLEPGEMLLASAADGKWTEEQRVQVLTWCEYLRLLRWTLGIDAELIPLAHCPRVDYTLGRDILQLKDDLSRLASGTLRPSWDLRGQRDTALAYFARIVSELSSRSLITGDVDLVQWA